MVEWKNYSFYMATDFTELLEKVQAHDNNLKTLSRSQALYFIISTMAKEADGIVDEELEEGELTEEEQIEDESEDLDAEIE